MRVTTHSHWTLLIISRGNYITACFSVVSPKNNVPEGMLERQIRYEAARWFRKYKLIPRMIEKIKELLYVTDSGGNP